ncbi:Zinc finger Ran-binding domain-containing protein 2 [Acropora cervicornis]|uniref:Zinc finger Ran-binding domain-containing protein 2 n=1 Tax=Acropora cervicornis TaxID=6130 RepID=A0AAD9PWB9_ACRCE|nr:Zinc finger Ran-binding domain-containing protein 2 [Acropora cervicornis]
MATGFALIRDKGSNDSIKFTGSQIGKQAAAKSKGLFSADDWMCSKCGNVNWARRSDCNMCGHPKFSKVEQRTGYGGGYNEREGVEYIKRDDSDDEFDEFGRRRKSKHGGHQPALEPKVTSLLPQDEEEEDSDEDGDLSKYNLDDEMVTCPSMLLTSLTLKPRIRAVAQDQGHSPLPVKKSDAATALHHHHHHRRDQEAVLHDQTAVQDLVQEAQALDRDPNRTPSHVQDQGLPDDQGKRGF